MTNLDDLPATSTRYRTKGGIQNLRPRSKQGVIIAVECLDLKTGKVKCFESLSSAAHYLKNHFDSDKPSVSCISNHVRKSFPVPYYEHLWRIKSHESKPWPDYSHLDISQVKNGLTKTHYPVYILNIKTREVYKCKDFDSVVKIVDILLSVFISYLRKRNVYKKSYLFSHTRKSLFQEKVRNARKFYTYHLLDTRRSQEYSFDTAKSTGKHICISESCILFKFSSHKRDVIYVGYDNRYKITRVPR